MPATVAEQETVAVPDPVMVFGVIAPQVSPAAGTSVRVAVPVKPFKAASVIVDVADWPTFTAAGDVADIVKSTKLNVAVVE